MLNCREILFLALCLSLAIALATVAAFPPIHLGQIHPIEWHLSYLLLLAFVIGMPVAVRACGAKPTDALTLFGFLAGAAVAFLQFQTLEKTDETMRAGQRAYVGVADMPFPYPVVHEGKITGWRVAAVYENSGGSETQDLAMHIRFASLERPLSSRFSLTEFQAPKIAGDVSRSLAPKLRVSGNAICLTPRDMQDIVAQKRYFYVVAWATYKDRFGERRITEFCTQILRTFETYSVPKDYPQINGQTIQPPEIGYHLCMDHNCADDECIQNDPEASERKEHWKIAGPPETINEETFCRAD